MRFAIKNEIPCTENTEYLIFLKKEKKQMIYSKIPLKEIVLWNIPFHRGIKTHCNIVNSTLAVAFSTDFI